MFAVHQCFADIICDLCQHESFSSTHFHLLFIIIIIFSLAHSMLSLLFAQFHLIIKALERNNNNTKIILLLQKVCGWSFKEEVEVEKKNVVQKTMPFMNGMRYQKEYNQRRRGRRRENGQSKHEIRSNTFSSFVLTSIQENGAMD